MDTTQLIEALNARRTLLGLTLQKLADNMSKDVTTVSRQLSPSCPGMQLATLLEYASALGGEIQFITSETMATLRGEELTSVRLRMAEIGSQNERLRDKLGDKDEKIKLLENMLYRSQDQLQKLAVEYASLVARLAEKL